MGLPSVFLDLFWKKLSSGLGFDFSPTIWEYKEGKSVDVERGGVFLLSELYLTTKEPVQHELQALANSEPRTHLPPCETDNLSSRNGPPVH